MLKTSIIIGFVSAHFHEAAFSPGEKHNTEDELLPSFDIFGFTDLDILDFVTGAVERGFDRDVRNNWHYCFKHLTWDYIMNEILSMKFVEILIFSTIMFFTGD